MVFFLSIGVYEGVVILPSGSFERRDIFSMHSGICISFGSSLPSPVLFYLATRMRC